ncbi:hypothetical protein SDC9_50672 [bioreactor metagenome]|uniref:Uncharacterized protein n=1 Tax=bioreactor metagenome TaxID=1076179 RepID=A0A644WKI7_9ZZZZ
MLLRHALEVALVNGTVHIAYRQVQGVKPCCMIAVVRRNKGNSKNILDRVGIRGAAGLVAVEGQLPVISAGVRPCGNVEPCRFRAVADAHEGVAPAVAHVVVTFLLPVARAFFCPEADRAPLVVYDFAAHCIGEHQVPASALPQMLQQFCIRQLLGSAWREGLLTDQQYAFCIAAFHLPVQSDKFVGGNLPHNKQQGNFVGILVSGVSLLPCGEFRQAYGFEGVLQRVKVIDQISCCIGVGSRASRHIKKGQRHACGIYAKGGLIFQIFKRFTIAAGGSAVQRRLHLVVLVIRKGAGHKAGHICGFNVIFPLQRYIQPGGKDIALQVVAGEHSVCVVFGHVQQVRVALERGRVFRIDGTQLRKIFLAQTACFKLAGVQFYAVAPQPLKALCFRPVLIAQRAVVQGVQIWRVWRELQIGLGVSAHLKRVCVALGLLRLVAQHRECFRVLQMVCGQQGIGLLKAFLAFERLNQP